MKFAMAVGSRRHYVVGDILPRHFHQIANGSGLPASSVETIFAELGRDVPGALEKTANQMPPGFPQALLDSITRGTLNRLRLLEQAAQKV
jgi:serine/threonine-protein kinase HipA